MRALKKLVRALKKSKVTRCRSRKMCERRARIYAKKEIDDKTCSILLAREVNFFCGKLFAFPVAVANLEFWQ